ncbi:universal stress protein [Tsukamurella soli]|uniref:Universal stress protein n=1 Tax=Tsukamurella soli TaxID=644556 RepID=A0ABP8JPB6_9ACTN
MTDQATIPYILVCVDGSVAALEAADWAADEAQSRSLPLMLATVADLRGFAYGPFMEASDSAFAAIEKSSRDLLAEAERRVGERHPSVSTAVSEKAGSPSAELIALSRDAYLTVVGATGLGTIGSVLLGTVASALVTNGHSPVAVIRGGDATTTVPRTGPVVVGVDDGRGSETAIGWAFDEASRRRVALTVVHAGVGRPSDAARPRSRAGATEDAEQDALLSARLTGWRDKYPDVRVHEIVAVDDATDSLLHHAAGAQLVVVGSRGHGDLTGLLFGSVSRTLIHRAPCPVLVARNSTTH